LTGWFLGIDFMKGDSHGPLGPSKSFWTTFCYQFVATAS